MSSQILRKLILFDIFIVLGNKKALEKIDKEDAKIAKEAIDYFEQMLRMKSIFLLIARMVRKEKMKRWMGSLIFAENKSYNYVHFEAPSADKLIN